MALVIIVLAIFAFVVFMNKSDNTSLVMQESINRANHIRELSAAIDRKKAEQAEVNKSTNYAYWDVLRRDVERMQNEYDHAVAMARYC